MNIEKQGNRVAGALAVAIMMAMPITIGYYLVRLGFVELGLPPIFAFLSGILIAMGGSALLAWVTYKLIVRLAPTK